MAESQSSIRYMDTTAAYDLWSEVYDTDGNFLQALDTIEMKRLLPQMLQEIKSAKPWRIVDLGCGTGRNTAALLSIPDTQIIALDASPKMLEVARSRLADSHANLQFNLIDLLQSPPQSLQVDAVVSTLVIEHIPADNFFDHVAHILKLQGVLLLTNMHSEMGDISQAGFVDPKTGEKIRPKSYSHTTHEIQISARKHGLELIAPLQERSVDDELSRELGVRSKKWIGITVWFGGLFRRIS